MYFVNYSTNFLILAKNFEKISPYNLLSFSLPLKILGLNLKPHIISENQKIKIRMERRKMNGLFFDFELMPNGAPPKLRPELWACEQILILILI